MPLTPTQTIGGFITTHEGGMSVDASDNGNWYDAARYKAGLPFKRGMGVNVGSNWGVTAYALVRYRLLTGVPAAKALIVSRADMAALTKEQAIAIGVKLFFEVPHFDTLVWNRVTMSIVDKGWGSGPSTAIMMLQKLLGLRQDGAIGPLTAQTYAAWVAKAGEEAAAKAWCAAREAKDFAIAHNEGPNDPDLRFLKGWNNRSESFLPGTSWWKVAG